MGMEFYAHKIYIIRQIGFRRTDSVLLAPFPESPGQKLCHTEKIAADPGAEAIAQAEALFQEEQRPDAAQLKLLCRAGEKDAARALALALMDEVDRLGLENSDSPRAASALLAARDALTICGDGEAAQAAQNRVQRTPCAPAHQHDGGHRADHRHRICLAGEPARRRRDGHRFKQHEHHSEQRQIDRPVLAD